MKRLFMSSLALITFSIGIIFFQISCKKEAHGNPPEQVCKLLGTYVGTSTTSEGSTNVMTYDFRENNFAVGRVQPTGAAVTFGGFRNTCDSVFISVFYTDNSNYYLLKGKFSNEKNTITGTYNNLTTPADFGTFTISK